MAKHSIEYEVIGRAVVVEKSGLNRHYLKLLYRGDGTPWWACSAALELLIPEDFEASPGEMIKLSIERLS